MTTLSRMSVLGLGFSLLVGSLLLSPTPAEVVDFAYSTIDPRHEAKFRIGFWQNPDLSLLQFSHDSFREKLRLLGRRFEEAMREPLAEAGFGVVEISIVSDYPSLFDERVLGRFDLLHCDPATYVLLKNEDWEPYTAILEETPRAGESFGEAGIWVREDSPYREPMDLANKRIAQAARTSLLGGALQRAKLWNSIERPLREGREFRAVYTGSVSEGVLRLVTGLGTEEPVEAAFLPSDDIGFQAAAQLLGLRRPEDIPIRRIDAFPEESLPGPALLINRFLLDSHPELGESLVKFFASQNLPWNWRTSDDRRYEPLAESLSRLPRIESDSP